MFPQDLGMAMDPMRCPEGPAWQLALPPGSYRVEVLAPREAAMSKTGLRGGTCRLNCNVLVRVLAIANLDSVLA